MRGWRRSARRSWRCWMAAPRAAPLQRRRWLTTTMMTTMPMTPGGRRCRRRRGRRWTPPRRLRRRRHRGGHSEGMQHTDMRMATMMLAARNLRVELRSSQVLRLCFACIARRLLCAAALHISAHAPPPGSMDHGRCSSTWDPFRLYLPSPKRMRCPAVQTRHQARRCQLLHLGT